MTNLEINLTPTATLLEIDSVAKIPCRTWGMASESSAAFLLIHGLGGHSGWFEALARRLKVKQIFVLALDLASFGRRRQEKYVSIGQWLKDIEIVSTYLHSLMGEKPLFVLGNSMGGLIALKACATIKPSGLALLAPAFAGHPKLFPVSYQLSGFLKALMAPNKDIVMPYSTDLITKQEQVRTWLDNNGDIRLAVPGKMLLDLLFLTQSTRMKKISLSCPLFMITAGQDAIVDNQASELIFRQINAPMKKKINIQKAMHDLTLDLAVDQVADLLIEWSVSLLQNKDRLKAVSNQRDK